MDRDFIMMVIVPTIFIFFSCFLSYRLWMLIQDSLYCSVGDTQPTLTGEYWQPDWWETLTWPYLDVQTMQIQELQKENDRLKEAYRSVESKLQKEKRCWDLECWTIVWFIDWHAISFWRVIFYADEEIKEGEIWWYEIQTEEQYHSKEYYWFERILPKSDTYRSKEELLKHIKGM